MIKFIEVLTIMRNTLKRKTQLLEMLRAEWFAKAPSEHQSISEQRCGGTTNQIFVKITRKLDSAALVVGVEYEFKL